MLAIVFWTALGLLLYAFVGYPLLMRAVAGAFGKDTARADDLEPSVSVVLSVYNEAAIIREKINNFLALEYPVQKLEFIIVSDCSDDGTDEIVRSLAGERVRLLVQPKRSGKTRNLNRGVAEARGEVVLFTDANSMFDPDAVRKLVRHFADPGVGLVSGKSLYLDREGSATSGAAYRRYEDFIKASEGRLAGIVGADGAIYAMRRRLYEELRPEFINDFIHTIDAARKGYRAISEDAAVCREVVEEGGGGELRRQTRIMAQSWLIFVSRFPRLVADGKLGYAWQLFSHKFLRWLTVPLMLVLFVTNLLLLESNAFYQAVFSAQVVFLALVALGGGIAGGVLKVPHVFMVLHWAALAGLFKFLSGDIYTTWNPREN